MKLFKPIVLIPELDTEFTTMLQSMDINLRRIADALGDISKFVQEQGSSGGFETDVECPIKPGSM